METDPIPDIFAAALAIESESERKKYLDEACGEDAALRNEVEALLRSHREAGSFFADRSEKDGPKDEGSGDDGFGNTAAVEQTSVDASVGSLIRPYKLVQRIGEGGMGEVWVAKQSQPVKRKVALKLIKKGMDSRAALARFEQERQALAMMEHPNIARVFDAGISPDGQPYFVMELVNGLPVNRFCDEAKLSLEKRLELFVAICQAVQHAHQKGIVHRDLKPANVLVTLIDGRPVPKVIDFGVAKALSGNLTAETLTEFGAVVGTLEYMSPEQASFSGTDVDTRADIYSLGVILYELLTGLRPIDKERLRTAALNEMIRIIREEEPSKPSTRLSTDESLQSMAALRQTDPRKLMSLLRGELDWVVMKCLEKDRDRRYDTANGLLRDLQRYLASEPVEARPPSSSYRLRKFLARNRGPAIAASLLLLTLVFGIVGTTWGLIEARRQAEIARQETVKKQEALQAETAAKQEAQRQTELAHEAVDKYLNTVTEDPQLKYDNFHDLRKKLLETAIPFYEEFVASEADDPQLLAEQGDAYRRLGFVQDELGEHRAALASSTEMQRIFAELTDRYPGEPEYQASLANSHANLGSSHRTLGNLNAAEKEYRTAMEISQVLVEQSPEALEYRRSLALSKASLGTVLSDRGEHQAAEKMFRAATGISQMLVEKFPEVQEYQSDLAGNHNRLGLLLVEIGDHQAAENVYREAVKIDQVLVEQFPDRPEYQQRLAAVLNNLGVLLKKIGKYQAAEHEYRAAIKIQKRLAEKFPDVPNYRKKLANSLTNLGRLLIQIGEHQAVEKEFTHHQTAEKELRAAFEIRKGLVEQFPEVPNYRDALATSLINQGAVLLDIDDRGAAEHKYRAATEIQKTLVEQFPDSPKYRKLFAMSLHKLGSALRMLGQHQAAGKEIRAAIEIRKTLAEQFPEIPEYREDLATSHDSLGYTLCRIGEHQAAEKELRAARKIREVLVEQFPNVPEHRRALAGSYYFLGHLLYEAGEHDAAEKEFKSGLAISEPFVRKYPTFQSAQMTHWRLHAFLAALFHDTGRLKAAESEYRAAAQSLEVMVEMFPERRMSACMLAGTRLKLAGLMKKLSDFEAAEKEYRAFVRGWSLVNERFPHYGWDAVVKLKASHSILASFLEKVGKLEAAEKEYRASLRLALDRAEQEPLAVPEIEYENLTRVLVKMRRADEACDLTREAAARFPESKRIDFLSKQINALKGAVLGYVASWSADGKALAFKVPNDEKPDNLVIAPLDESGQFDQSKQRTIVTGMKGDGLDSLWSPAKDGPIAFVRRFDGKAHLWLVDPDGKNLRRLSQGYWPAGWSKDGGQLYFMNGKQLCEIEVTQEDATPDVLMELDAFRTYPAVSPDGKMVAQHRNDKLVITEIETKKTITEWPVDGWHGVFPAWSPDMQFVAFGSFDSGRDAGKGLWILDIKRQEAFEAIPDVGTIPRWSPAGSRLVIDLRGLSRHVKIVDIHELSWPKDWAGTLPSAINKDQ